jgi:hypothetical protein
MSFAKPRVVIAILVVFMLLPLGRCGRADQAPPKLEYRFTQPLEWEIVKHSINRSLPNQFHIPPKTVTSSRVVFTEEPGASGAKGTLVSHQLKLYRETITIGEVVYQTTYDGQRITYTKSGHLADPSGWPVLPLGSCPEAPFPPAAPYLVPAQGTSASFGGAVHLGEVHPIWPSIPVQEGTTWHYPLPGMARLPMNIPWRVVRMGRIGKHRVALVRSDQVMPARPWTQQEFAFSDNKKVYFDVEAGQVLWAHYRSESQNGSGQTWAEETIVRNLTLYPFTTPPVLSPPAAPQP